MAVIPQSVLDLPSSSSLDLPAIQELIQSYSQAIDDAKSRVHATVQANSSQFVQTAAQLQNLEENVLETYRRVEEIKAQLGDPLAKAGGLVGRFEAAKADVARIREEVDGLEATTDVLRTICKLLRQFVEFDAALQGEDYDLAADLLKAVGDVVNGGLALDPKKDMEEEELGVLTYLHMEYHLRRGLLMARLQEVFQSFFVFFPHTAMVYKKLPADSKSGKSSNVKLEHVWYAFKSLGDLKARVLDLSREVLKEVVDPLFSAALNLESGCVLTPKEGTAQTEAVMWTWTVSGAPKASPASSSSSSSSSSTSSSSSSSSSCSSSSSSSLSSVVALSDMSVHEHLVPLLESLFLFIHANFFHGMQEAIGIFGISLWGALCQQVVYGLPTPTPRGAEMLKDFETKMRALQLIPFEEKTLSGFVVQYLQKLFDQQKTQILAEVRYRVMCEDLTTVQVDDSTEIGSLTNAVRKLGCRALGLSGKKGKKGGGIRPNVPMHQQPGLSVREKEEDKEMPMELPHCSISRSVHTIVEKIHELMREAVQAHQTGKDDMPQQFFLLARDIVVLFMLVRPMAHKSRIASDPAFAAVMFTDIGYIIHHLTTIPYTYGSSFPSGFTKSGLCFVDLIFPLRNLQESLYLEMLRNQRRQLTAFTSQFGDFTGLSLDVRYAHAEAAIGGALQHVKGLASQWRTVLPNGTAAESLALFVDVLLTELTDKVLALPKLPAADVSALSHLLASALAQLKAIVGPVTTANRGGAEGAGGGRAVTVESCCKLWESFTLLRELLEADFAVYVDKEADIRRCFTRDQLARIVTLNPNVQRSTDEVVRTIMT